MNKRTFQCILLCLGAMLLDGHGEAKAQECQSDGIM